MAKTSDLKNTLNLPRTTFPMKASLPQTEPKQLAEWEEQGIYRKILESRAGRPQYVFHDGPPYPTGEIHLGTGLNKVLKDMVVKSRTMMGMRAPYVPGWDCHGLPIETKVEKELTGGKGSIPPAEFRRRCREFAMRYVDIHRREFKRLGIFGQWDDPYLTMSNQYEATIAGAFVTFLEKGYVYRGLKPVYWCIFDSTALAEAEVEYEDHTSPSIWVKFRVAGGTSAALPQLGANVDAVIWTTTPWTLPANRALAFHPDLDYVVVETEQGALLLAEQLVPRVSGELKLTPGAVRGKWKGSALEGLQFQHPFLDSLRVPAVLGEHVTLEAGTGIVHTAPGHGAEDFYTGQKYGLDTFAPLDDQGRFTEGLQEYKGRTVFDANPHIVELLKSRGALMAAGKLTHSYPHCWRCHNPVIFRATEQWFIDMERAASEGPLRPRALAEIKKVKWKPAWGEQRISDMVEKRPDWCISRQRMWGVPLIVFHCAAAGCRHRLEDYAALRNVVKMFYKEGADAWFSRTAEELLPPGTKCVKCGATKWEKENDILDVWFDSGSSHLAVLDPVGQWPADCYLEGPDQYRGWFQSSLLVGVGAKGAAPYKQVVTHGWTLDEKDQPMSKSLGNVLEPKEICQQWGADLLRLWVVSQDYTADVSMSHRVMTQLAEAYRKIRNTFRYILGNLEGFDPARDAVSDAEMLELDRWMLQRTGVLAEQCRGWYETFDFHRVFHAIHDFCVVELSSFYFDVLKDRLYTSGRRSVARRSAQTAIWHIGHALERLAAPILVFTTEEVWKLLPRHPSDPESVHIAEFPAAAELQTGLNEEKSAEWFKLVALRNVVLKSLEEARQAKTISSSLEAKVELAVTASLGNWLEKYAEWLKYLFIVSSVDIKRVILQLGDHKADAKLHPEPFVSEFIDPFGGVRVTVTRADGSKCERCWNYSTRVGEFADYPTVCERCIEVVREYYAAQPAASPAS